MRQKKKKKKKRKKKERKKKKKKEKRRSLSNFKYNCKKIKRKLELTGKVEVFKCAGYTPAPG